MGEWFWIKFAPADEWQPAWLDEKGRYYPATENGWFNAEEIWEIGPPVACPDALIEAERRGAERMRERAAVKSRELWADYEAEASPDYIANGIRALPLSEPQP